TVKLGRYIARAWGHPAAASAGESPDRPPSARPPPSCPDHLPALTTPQNRLERLLAAALWPYVSLLLAGDHGHGLRLLKSPGIIRRISALLGRGKAHIGQCTPQVRWLNVAGQEAVDNRQVARIACRIVLEDPLAGVGAEGVHPADVRDQPGRCTNSWATHGNLARVAHNGKRLGIGAGDSPLAHILGDGMPIGAKTVVPTGVLGFQPLTLRCTHPRIRVPPDGRSPEPDP